MRILLDENFPIQLERQLSAAGYDAEHILSLGQRGLPDSAIRARMVKEDLLFLTQDIEFADGAAEFRGAVIISRVPQDLPIRRRLEIWVAAIEKCLKEKPAARVLELRETMELIPWTKTEYR